MSESTVEGAGVGQPVDSPRVTDLEARKADVEASQQNRVAADQSFASPQRLNADFVTSTADGFDSNVGWTVQHGSAAPVNEAQNRPGQVFTVDQLPDPEVARAAGMPPQQISSEYVVSGDEAFLHPSGPDAGEALRAAQRAAVSQSLMGDTGPEAEADRVAGANEVPGGDNAEEASKKDEAVRVKAANQSSLDGGNNEGTAGENGQPAPGRADSTATGDKVAE